MNVKKLLSGVVILLGLLPLTLCGQSAKLTGYSFKGGASFTSLSNNGLWATAKGLNADDATKDAYPYLLNVATGEQTCLVSEAEFPYMISAAYDVTDDGQLVVGCYDDMPATYNVSTKKWTKLPLPASSPYLTGKASSVTPDGRCIVGTLMNGEVYQEVPFLFVDGVYTPCEGLPTVDISGVNQNQNRFVAISSDGNIILGGLSFSYPGSGCCYYVYNRQTKSYQFLGKNELNNESFVDEATLSADGKWIGGIIHMVHPNTDDQFANEYKVGFRYDVVNGQMLIFDNGEEDVDTGVFVINNSGTVFAGSPWGSPARAMKYRVNGFWYGLDVVLKDRYSIDYTTYGYENTGTPIAISADGKTLLGIPYSGINYVLTLPETFEEAAKTVNLLATAFLSPASGTSFSKLTTLKITFDRVVEKKSGATAALYEGDKLVASSLSISSANASGREYTIGFRSQTLKAGVAYTVKVKAGSFGIPNSDVINKEVTANYIGRADIPVQPQTAAPADGSTVSELSYSSPMTIQFDVPLLLKENVTGKLYQEGNSEPICNLTLASSANMMAVYPTLKQYLYKDINYSVVIPAGAATDIMGNCANEEITLEYVGVYQKTAPSVGSNLFEENFNEPANTYSHFLLYEGDHNNPTAEATGWSFDKDNTPWNFQIRESEETDDYCAASISMYSPVGKSDDWMSTVQLTVPDNSYVLYWKSQSYKKAKADRLKVYVWECENELFSLNKELVARIQKEGHLVYDAVEAPGSSEAMLSDDWVEHKVSLAAYSGKNIYIAFANQNDNQSAIFLDDLRVVFEGTFAVGSVVETSVTQQEKIAVKGFVKVTGDDTYQSFKAICKAADGTVIDELTQTGLNLKKGDTAEFSFTKELPLALGKINAYSIAVEMGGEVKELKATVSNLAFLPKRKVVLEEATGAWCANCPQGILAVEHMQKSYPDQFIAIATHGGGSDPYTNSSYVGFLNTQSYPSGRINRSKKLCAPMINENGAYSFVSQAGDGTFMDIFLKELELDSEAEVKLAKAEYDVKLNKMLVETSVNYAVDIAGGNYNVFYAILEDKLPSIQENNLYNSTDPIFGPFGKGGVYGTAKVRLDYDHVARAIIGTSFNGLGGYIPTSVVANKPISFSLESVLPTAVLKMENASVVCMLIDANTGRVVNADQLKFTSGVGLDETLSDAEAGVTLRMDGKQVIVEFAHAGDAVVTLYSLNGTVIDQTASVVGAGESLTTTANGHAGVILVRISSNGQVITKKVVIP